MVNTEHYALILILLNHYNILNIVVNTEPGGLKQFQEANYNILNIVVNTERWD